MRAGKAEPRRDCMSDELVGRMLAGEHPLRLWREHRNMTVRGLAKRAGLTAAYVSEIETGRKPGSLTALKALAAALDVEVDLVLPWPGRPKTAPRRAARRRELPQLSGKG